MKILERHDRRVEAAVLFDALSEGGEFLLHDERAAIVRIGDWTKCVTGSADDIAKYKAKGLLDGNVCYVGAPLEAQSLFEVYDAPCKTFAYLNKMPPEFDGAVTVKRLAPSLAETVRGAYCGDDGIYTVDEMAELMRGKGVFGAIVDGKLAGFIGRHDDGSMGMLEVFEPFRRRGIAAALEKFLIGYIMTFLRVPHCDVYTDNPASLALQEKLGLTASSGYTFWVPSK